MKALPLFFQRYFSAVRLQRQAVVMVMCACALFVAACGEKAPVSYKQVSFSNLPGWQADSDIGSLATAFERSCRRILTQKPGPMHTNNPLFGTVEQWQGLCIQFGNLENGDIKQFFESNLVPYQVLPRKNKPLFTGYYEPLLEGRFEQSEEFSVPLYRRPGDMVSVDLGQFDPALAGKGIQGRLVGNRLLPYYTRAEIEAGGRMSENDVLLWLKDPVDVFFLHVQGSGRVLLPSGRELTVGFAAHNGQPYTSVGKILVDTGAMKIENVSLFTLRQWFAEHPEQRDEILRKNNRFVFFRFTDNGAQGAQGAELTAERSLAVDTTYTPLGIPVFVSTTLSGENNAPLQKLMIAQDIGGAIKGAARGDVFFGNGARAEKLAGYQNAGGSFYVLVPRQK